MSEKFKNIKLAILEGVSFGTKYYECMWSGPGVNVAQKFDDAQICILLGLSLILKLSLYGKVTPL